MLAFYNNIFPFLNIHISSSDLPVTTEESEIVDWTESTDNTSGHGIVGTI